MKKIKTYSEILESLKIGREIFEKSMDPDKISKIRRLKDSSDIKGILSELNPIIDDIKDRCRNIYFDDISYSDKNGVLNIVYGSEIDMLLVSLKYKTATVGDEIDERIFGGGWSDMILEIELDGDLFNRIDIINGLPNFMKGIGLGKKIYKKLIKDFNYISTFVGFSPSIDSSMVWESIAGDVDIFTFSNGENIIGFWKDYSYDSLVNTLKNFYLNRHEDSQFDDDFLIRYNLSEDKLKELIF